MSLLWKYEDYVQHLTHENVLVRQWAFSAIENRYYNRYTDEVKYLLEDDDAHLASASARYLAHHGALQHAPLILEGFKRGQGFVPSNCARALAKLRYEDALEDIITSLSTHIHSESLFGIFEYLGAVFNDNSRDTLISAVQQLKDPMLKGHAMANLLRHNHPEDIEMILKMLVKALTKTKRVDDILVGPVLSFFNAATYFKELTSELGPNKKLPAFKTIFQAFFNDHSYLVFETDLLSDVAKQLDAGRYHDAITILMFDIQKKVQHRYDHPAGGEDISNIPCRDLFVRDAMAAAFAKSISRQPMVIKRIKSSGKKKIIPLIFFTLSIYMGVLQRRPYARALEQDADVQQVLQAVKQAGPDLSDSVGDKLAAFAPISELKNSLSEKFDTWEDIWIVRIMGKIGEPAFLPELLRILNQCDFMSYIFNDALKAIGRMSEPADEMILEAVRNRQISAWERMALLKHLPYAQAFDLVVKEWEDEDSDMDALETFVFCLQCIADKRGIPLLQEMYTKEGLTTGIIGDALELLSILHQVEIPELSEIRNRRKVQSEGRAEEDGFLDELLAQADLEDHFEDNTADIIPFKRTSAKIGRNELCPCGSGKKYKKCCLNKV